LLFADGHVDQVKDEFVARASDGKGDVADGGNQGTVTDTLAGMKVLDDYLDILETEAIGANPLRSISSRPGTPLKYPLRNREDDAKANQAVLRY
jgi:hypothetical protein